MWEDGKSSWVKSMAPAKVPGQRKEQCPEAPKEQGPSEAKAVISGVAT